MSSERTEPGEEPVPWLLAIRLAQIEDATPGEPFTTRVEDRERSVLVVANIREDELTAGGLSLRPGEVGFVSDDTLVAIANPDAVRWSADRETWEPALLSLLWSAVPEVEGAVDAVAVSLQRGDLA